MHVRDGDSVALEGFTHLIPFAAGHEIVRQGRQELTLVRMTPDLIYDQMIGMGAATRLVFSYGGNPGVGSLHRFRDAVENGWPRPLEVLEHSHAGMANAYVAGAARLPFAVLRGYAGTDLATRNPAVAFVDCPFTGQRLTAVQALNPDVAVIHAQQADRQGNVMLWGLSRRAEGGGARREPRDRDRRGGRRGARPRPHSVILPAWTIAAVAVVPGGAWPSYAAGYSVRDNDFYAAWDEISRDRDRFTAWMQEHVLRKPVETAAAT